MIIHSLQPFFIVHQWASVVSRCPMDPLTVAKVFKLKQVRLISALHPVSALDFYVRLVVVGLNPGGWDIGQRKKARLIAISAPGLSFRISLALGNFLTLS